MCAHWCHSARQQWRLLRRRWSGPTCKRLSGRAVNAGTARARLPSARSRARLERAGCARKRYSRGRSAGTKHSRAVAAALASCTCSKGARIVRP